MLAAVTAGGFTLDQRRRLAAAAFAHTAAYDVAVAPGSPPSWRPTPDGWPAFLGAALERSAVLRYGENPHQRAALYVDPAGPAAWPRPSSCTARR